MFSTFISNIFELCFQTWFQIKNMPTSANQVETFQGLCLVLDPMLQARQNKRVHKNISQNKGFDFGF